MDINSIIIFIVGAIFLFAILDLIVGVSNDAINFLSPSIGSKVASHKNILIIASLGILAGVLFSSGMMEVARKGIFHPQHFVFMEMIIIFLSVIVADIVLLNKFNSLGMPTSTTVSIVFCLLGSAVAVGVVKIYNNGLSIGELSTYINTAKVLVIILGILGSVIASFFLGSIIQYITRLFFTFDYKNKPKYWVSILGAIAITAITHFILVKGLKGSIITGYQEFLTWVNGNLFTFLSLVFIIWFIILQFLLFLKVNVFKLIVLTGTFSLAMAFAGNDLVNFIGVPLAALKSYNLFSASGVADASAFFMDGLNNKEKANVFLLLISGAIMIATIYFSKKARAVLNTGLDLSRQHEGKENFSSSSLSKVLVRYFILGMKIIQKLMPKTIWDFVGKRFIKVKETGKREKKTFDLIRASVVLICSSILISIATSYKLPLSTTYVTFMVAMGAAFADRAWGRESAVYRVNGVLNVVGGWFITAFGAFVFSFLIAIFISFGKMPVAIFMILFTIFIMGKPFFIKPVLISEEKGTEEIRSISKGFVKGMRGYLELGQKYYSEIIQKLGEEDISTIKHIHKDIENLKDNIYNFKKASLTNIPDIDEKDMRYLPIYMGMLDAMKGFSKSLNSISENITEYVDNNHVFSSGDYKDLVDIDKRMNNVYKHLYMFIDTNDFEQKYKILKALIKDLNKYVENSIERVKNGKTDMGSSMLFISITNETKYLLLEISSIYKKLGEL